MSKKIGDRVELICACGSTFVTTQRRISNGRGKFCSRACAGRNGPITHGMSRSDLGRRTYTSWAMMKGRCSNPKNPRYAAYGAVGIRVCARWKAFEHFVADMGERPEGTSLDRIDGTKGYEPGNCRWATPHEQQTNLRTNRFVNYQGDSLPLCELARALEVRPSTLSYRIDAGWPEGVWGAARWRGNRASSISPVNSGLISSSPNQPG